MNPKQLFNAGNGKIILIAGLGVLATAAVGAWIILGQKAPEGGACASDSKCRDGMKCVAKTCSSGNVGSACNSKDDCLAKYCVSGKCTGGLAGGACSSLEDCATGFCVSGFCAEGKKGSVCLSKDDCTTKSCVLNKCSDGKNGDACATYKDCDSGLFCQKGACVAPPDYSKYFNKVIISKMKPGLPPGPNNVPVATNEFKNTDALEIDFSGVKPANTSEFYFEIVNAVSGEVAMSMNGFKQKFAGHDFGTGTDIKMLEPGDYDLNIYVDNEIAYTAQIKVINQ